MLRTLLNWLRPDRSATCIDCGRSAHPDWHRCPACNGFVHKD